MVEGSQTHMDVRRCTQTNTDKRKANCVRWVGGHNLQMIDVCSRTFGTYYMCCSITLTHLPSILQMGRNTESQTSQSQTSRTSQTSQTPLLHRSQRKKVVSSILLLLLLLLLLFVSFCSFCVTQVTPSGKNV